MLETLEPASVDLAIFSPPFATLYAYSSEPEDMGNSTDANTSEFLLHFRHFTRGLARVVKPGRVVCMHLAQITYAKAYHGRDGIRDLRGMMIGAMERAGFLYDGEFVIDKNPQAAAVRTKSSRLTFAQFERNSLKSAPVLCDFVMKFRREGDSAVPVKPQATRDEWIAWARGVWSDIRETDVLQGWHRARSEEDEKHICPLQLPVINRCIRLWSNPGETVLDPFDGIGSTVDQAIRLGRFGLGIELKREYWLQSLDNANRAVAETHEQLRLAV
jgi:hypothetical protein